MLVHVLRRLGQSVIVLLVVSFIAFVVFRYIGDPTISLLGEDASVQERQAMMASLGFDRPVAEQYSITCAARCRAISASLIGCGARWST